MVHIIGTIKQRRSTKIVSHNALQTVFAHDHTGRSKTF